MKQITEDYCSFETAKLLKEKGFRAVTNRYYNAQYGQIRTVSDSFMMDWNDEEYTKSITMPGAIAIPTHQMALKWLREVHNIYIDILTYTTGKNIQFRWVGYDKGRLFSQEESRTIYFEPYEKAVEAACLYVLKNLI